MSKSTNTNLNKKRQRPISPLTITIGKLPHDKYYYITDSLSNKNPNTKIKISMLDLKDDKQQIILKEHEEEKNATLDVLNMDPQILRGELPKIINSIEKNETENIYLPISASWFNMDNIHEIEMKTLPEFFVGKYPTKTPAIYKNYRNFIINLYRENSSSYLSSKTCMKHLAGDSGAILRIHSFLENWGLINFKINPKFKPNFIPKAFNFKSPVFIDFNLFAIDNTKKNDNINNYNNPENSIMVTNNKKNVALLHPINKISNDIFNKFLDNLNNMEKFSKENDDSEIYKNFQKINFLSKNYRPKCDICGNFCMVNWYITKENFGKNEEENESDAEMGVSISIDENSLKRDFFLICEECYNNKEIALPNNLKRENFELSSVYNLLSRDKLNPKLIDKINQQKWTEEEDKKLLESLKSNNNWDDIMKSLGQNNTKSKKDCIIHLIQMPLEHKESTESEKNKEKEITEEEHYIEANNHKEHTEDQIINEINMKNGEGEENINKNENIEMQENNDDDLNNNKENFIKINNQIKIEEEKKEQEKNDKINNNMINILMKMFQRYLNEKNTKSENNCDENGNIINKCFKDVIYKTFAKSIDKCKELKNIEKNEMKNIVDILVFLQMKKIELKMNYFRQFERLLEFKKNQLKTIETQIIQERIKLITKKLLLQQKQQQVNENK